MSCLVFSASGTSTRSLVLSNMSWWQDIIRKWEETDRPYTRTATHTATWYIKTWQHRLPPQLHPTWMRWLAGHCHSPMAYVRHAACPVNCGETNCQLVLCKWPHHSKTFYCTPCPVLPNDHPLLPNSGWLLVSISEGCCWVHNANMYSNFYSPLRPCSCSGLEVAILPACAMPDTGGGGGGVGGWWSHLLNGTWELVDYVRERNFTASQQHHTCLANCCVHLCYVSVPVGPEVGNLTHSHSK